MKFLTLIAFLIPACLFAQTGYKIDFKIDGLRDTTTYLCYYYNESTYIADTARIAKDGKFSFFGPKKLPSGVYFVVVEKMRLFEMVISDQQHFSMQTNTAEYVANMKVTGDEDNRLFFENMVYNADHHKVADPYMKVIKDSTLTEDQKKEARAAFEKVSAEVIKHQDELVAKHPKTMTARLIKVSKPIEIPEPPKKADGSVDSTFRFRYYRQHFFDHLDLADDAMIRLPKPLYQEKVNEYLDKLFFQSPDSIFAGINGMVSKVKHNKETYKFLVWTCMYKYQKPPIMGLDEVFVKMYDTYFATGEMDFWVNAQLKKNLKEHADKLRSSLIGKMGANLSMQDQNFQKRSLYDIHKKYTIIYFFDPDCGHCREESPKLVDFYNKNKTKLDLEVFAVSADTSISKMKEYVREMKMTWITVNGPRSYVGQYAKLYYAESTPTIYVLDDKKKIIAKGLQADRLEEFFTNYERFMQKKGTTKGKGT